MAEHVIFLPVTVCVWNDKWRSCGYCKESYERCVSAVSCFVFQSSKIVAAVRASCRQHNRLASARISVRYVFTTDRLFTLFSSSIYDTIEEFYVDSKAEYSALSMWLSIY